MLEDFHEPAPEGPELEEFLAQPKHHLARLLRDLFADEAAATTMEVGVSHATLLPVDIHAESSCSTSTASHPPSIDAFATHFLST